jgi:hypothetical protein
VRLRTGGPSRPPQHWDAIDARLTMSHSICPSLRRDCRSPDSQLRPGRGVS